MKSYDQQDDSSMMSDSMPDHEQQTNPVFVAGSSAGFGSFGDDDDDVNLMSTGSGRRRLREGTLLLLVVLLIASGILVGMRWMGTRGIQIDQDVAIETKVDAFLQAYQDSVDQANNPDAGGTQAEIMVNNLTDDRTASQVPLEDIRFNPFVLHVPGEDVTTDPNDGQDPDARRLQQQREAQRRLQLQYQAEVDRMMLGSILGSPGRFVAQLDDNIVQVGDMVNEGRFLVTKISATSITLQAEHFEFTLTLGE
ncbi:MAG: hypothetical protein D8M59_03290 [Planctomycetes bacterium]|nr:hypothetical protein [Planctomycetota bacterium]NOG53021.1 hypothetical protein [Planctomycetota bacterium]